MILEQYIQNKLIIIRGPSGFGKTTFANEIKNKLKNTEIFEADDYFYQEGKYKFDGTKLDKAHAYCKKNVYNALLKNENAIVSNTSTKIKEMLPYIEMAKELKIPFYIIRMNKRYKNIHNVPKEKVEAMIKRMENYNGEISPEEFMKNFF